MIRQLAPPHPQLFPETSVRSDEIMIDFMLGLSCNASNWATVGLSAIRNAKYVMLPAEDPPVQTIVNRGAREPMSCPVATSERGPIQVTLVRSAANDSGAESIDRNDTDTAARTAHMAFNMSFAPKFGSP